MSDKPNTKLTKLEKMSNEIKICDDFYIGALKVMVKTYLPIWSGEDDAGYKVRVATTAFANLFAPVVDGIAGMVTKKEPTIIGFDNIDNIDLKHNSLASFMKTTIKKSITSGVAFVSAETNTVLNRAYLKRYEYKNLYSYVVEDGRLTQIVFKDLIEAKDGEFGLIEQERYIVFKIGGGDVWFANKDTQELVKQDTESWTNSLKEIPLLGIVTGKVLSDFEVVPKLLDIALLNKVHLNLESSHANVLGIVGSPIPVFYGQTEEGKVTIGVKDALVFKDRQTEGFEYVEIKGQSIKELSSKIAGTEAQIDKLTFSILLSEDSKTVIDAQQKQSKNTSFLSDIANEVEEKFTKLLGYMVELENKTVPADAKLEMQKEFDAVLVNLELAHKILLAGDMSRETFYAIMKTGVLPKDFDVADDKEKIESEIQ